MDLEIKDNHPGVFADAWCSADQATPLPSVNPATEQVIGHVMPGDAALLDAVLSHAEKAAACWCAVPAPKRGLLVRRIGELLRDHKDRLGSLIAIEMGKSKAEGDGEVQEMIDMADFAVGQSRMLYGNTMPSERPSHRLYEQWHPLGIVGVISAFNFPMAVWSWNAFLAAICGDVVVWRPSSQVPFSAIAVQEICCQAMSELGYAGVFSLFISDDRALATQFVTDPRVKLLAFTGSTATGQQVAAQVAERLGRSLLELSGNNAMIIDDSANLSLAIPAIVFGAVGTAGQRCTSTRRVFIHDAIFDQVVDALKSAYAQIKIGDPTDASNHMGPLMNAAAVEAYQSVISALQSKNADIVFGGRVCDRPGFYVEPTLVIAENDWPMVQEETFVPILYLMRFQTIDEAIALQNHSAHGLSSAIFTQNLQHSELFLSSLGSDCGLANVNMGTSGAEIGGAFGGEKATGGGRQAGSDAWKAYMRRQTVAINYGDDLPLSQGIEFS